MQVMILVLDYYLQSFREDLSVITEHTHIYDTYTNDGVANNYQKHRQMCS